MEITFEVNKEKNDVQILGNGKEIGRIFSPAGSGHDVSNAIQVCGFDDAFSLWGCGVFGDGKGVSKKDIQLMFNSNSIEAPTKITDCWKCYNEPCTCKDLRVKTFEEVVEEKI